MINRNFPFFCCHSSSTPSQADYTLVLNVSEEACSGRPTPKTFKISLLDGLEADCRFILDVAISTSFKAYFNI